MQLWNITETEEHHVPFLMKRYVRFGYLARQLQFSIAFSYFVYRVNYLSRYCAGKYKTYLLFNTNAVQGNCHLCWFGIFPWGLMSLAQCKIPKCYSIWVCIKEEQCIFFYREINTFGAEHVCANIHLNTHSFFNIRYKTWYCVWRVGIMEMKWFIILFFVL